MENYAIQTTQNVQLNYRMASVGERILAFAIDLVMVGSVAGAIMFIFTKLKIENPVFFILASLPFIFYHLVCELVFQGQSLGKMIMKIKVISEDGSQVTFGRYLIRWVFRLFDIAMSMGVFAVAAIVATKKGQRIGDLAAGTALICTKLKPVFDESVFVYLPQEYQVVFPQAADLEYYHIKTLLDIMRFYTENPDKKEAILMVYTARKNVETRFGITTDLKPVEFIETVIKDFNALNRELR
ncbi:MAG TPA: hypothetical protein DCQ26_03395 [Marinilabiliales bacterium]|nr:MAG: hypothetical protein A2W95_12500 [Bacteroidetes bacterium GWA2_40_14]OFX58943.1 MAG: hypothetical protein A2W84_11520 [Bacteroidetes bacterium GWC2_40_13]OFX71314.1 MAG: hypothetical protein A2W96_14205 [Bacteroidetes bacterium GWD2_40_43]OFX91491.1 MAG: hypothetical protein A2W97_04650 [Bacteroidetes bacterium GWE2_40_63]OFY19560.1 MAG: hypothetical protein A2W88_02530 [Bacteroidetes bacterium GWF2_40_13]OFZ32174.1 MAG: hypothetical protein A2437_19350 [Bacteroidetes bacterium RIFOXYC